MSQWNLRYAAHMGYIRAVPPTLKHHAGGDTLERNLAEMSALGFYGVLHPWLPYIPDDERRHAIARIAASPLRGSVISAMAWREMKIPVWTDKGPTQRKWLSERVEAAARIAAQIGGSVLAVVVAADPLGPREAQLRSVRDNLGAVAPIAARHGVTLAVEPNRVLPNMLFESFDEALALIEHVDESNIGLIYDTAHASAMCDDPLETFERSYSRVVSIQIVDGPDRVEPGAGGSGFPFEALLASAMRRRFGGIVDLEFGWSDPSDAGERAGIERLRRLDADAARAAQIAPAPTR